MKYTMTEPCDQCPFLKTTGNLRTFSLERLRDFSRGEFPCHKSASIAETEDEGSEFVANEKSVQCAGALIFLEKRNHPNQMMRICERIGLYDRRKLNMAANVR